MRSQAERIYSEVEEDLITAIENYSKAVCDLRLDHFGDWSNYFKEEKLPNISNRLMGIRKELQEDW